MTEPVEDELLLRREGQLGHIVLNRPKAMNALTHGMVAGMRAALAEWANDAAVTTVVVSGAGERGLCAGGDIVGIYNDAKNGGNDSERFWAEEYRLNSEISRYPKPYVAIMDGVVLGGGIGISAHGSVRVVTERTRVGMPEVGIGFFPDVGGTWLLSHSPGELGTHAALTGGMLSGSDALVLGLADKYMPSDRLPLFIAALESESVESALARFTDQAPYSELALRRVWIDECYRGDDASAMVAALRASDSPEARETAEVIVTKSPTSVSVTLEALRRAARLGSLEEVLDQDMRVGLHFMDGTEIVEGIRAQVIDKDRNPQWSPSTLAGVRRAEIEEYFAGIGSRELGLSVSAAPEGK